MNSKAGAGQLAFTAVTASVISIGALLTYQRVSKRRERAQLNLELQERLDREEQAVASSPPIVNAEKEYEPNETIIREQLARNYAFFGEEGMAKIRGSRVAVIGCGGVGSWASVMLVRS